MYTFPQTLTVVTCNTCYIIILCLSPDYYTLSTVNRLLSPPALQIDRECLKFPIPYMLCPKYFSMVMTSTPSARHVSQCPKGRHTWKVIHIDMARGGTETYLLASAATVSPPLALLTLLALSLLYELLMKDHLKERVLMSAARINNSCWQICTQYDTNTYWE